MHASNNKLPGHAGRRVRRVSPLLLLALLAMLAAPTAVLAQGPGGQGGHHGMGGMGGMGDSGGHAGPGGKGRHLIMEAGHFVPEKQAELERLWNAHQKAVIPLKAEMQVARIDMGEAMHAFPLDEARADKQFQVMSALRAKLFAEHRKLVKDVQKLVGKDNWQKMQQNMRAHHRMGGGGQGMQGHHGSGGGMGPGAMGSGQMGSGHMGSGGMPPAR